MSVHLTAGGHVPIDEAWLAKNREPILEPGLPIIDPHHHIWDRHGETYLLPDLLRDTATGHDIRATVFIQCASMYDETAEPARQPLGETRFMTEVAKAAEAGRTRACAGIVGLVDLTLGERVTPLLEEHVAVSGGRFKGVRNRTAWDPSPRVRTNLEVPPPGPLNDPAFQEGARRLGELGLTLDVWAYHAQLPLVLDVARAAPGTTVVIDHCGGQLGVGPYEGKAAEVFADWRRSMAALAALPNVLVKLGGLAMEVSGKQWHTRPTPPTSEELAEDWRPQIETCIELFGTGRCMYESNFPVDKGMCGYAALWNAFKRLSAGASADEKTALFSGTAARAYRLSV
ncbi:amidohydrolase [Roseococcus sp. SYP-B2431]|uniref:amidohydrolase family protein n=1 Tax=Roseococcus sp. SYP-B2431 TaxID=2496640 RepID=UPI00103F6661|nr:amidohydrolase family protein [Roseococcus sp. SYP-B2431]TCH96184.1 amidohydrolase [Roseococcus sp. SYP-B2431]